MREVRLGAGGSPARAAARARGGDRDPRLRDLRSPRRRRPRLPPGPQRRPRRRRSITGSPCSRSASAGRRPIPPVLLAQARLDARDGVPLDTVLRRYFAGNALFGDFLVEEAERAEVPTRPFARLLARAGDARRSPARRRQRRARRARRRTGPSSAAERRRECVKSLLAGELVDHSELGYDLDAHHLGLMAKGEGAEEAMRELAGRLDRRLLAVRREEEPTWACWLGGRRRARAEEALRALARRSPRRGPRHRRRARRGPRGLAAQPPPGQGGAADRRAQGRGRRPLRRRRPARLDPPRRPPRRLAAPALPGAARSGRGTAARSRGRPCAPTSPPSATSPRPRPRSASIAARCANRLRGGRGAPRPPARGLGGRPRDRPAARRLTSTRAFPHW